MTAKLLLAACILAAAANAFAQSGEPENDGTETRNITNKTEAITDQASSKQPSVSAEVERSSRPPTIAETAAKDKDPIDTGYERLDAKQRFRNYLKNLGSPLATRTASASSAFRVLSEPTRGALSRPKPGIRPATITRTG